MPEGLVNFLRSNNLDLPSVFIQEDDNFSEIIPKEKLDRCEGNDDCVWNLLKASSPDIS